MPIRGQHRGSGAALRVVERLRASGRGAIEVAVEVLDQTVYVRPLVYGLTLRREAASSALYEYACDEGNRSGNRSMVGILRGVRADEQRALRASRAGVEVRAAAGPPGVSVRALPFWQSAGRWQG